MVRLVFHDAGSYSAAAGDGGLNASIRFELDRPDNFGLKRGWCAGAAVCGDDAGAAERKKIGMQALQVLTSAGTRWYCWPCLVPAALVRPPLPLRPAQERD